MGEREGSKRCAILSTVLRFAAAVSTILPPLVLVYDAYAEASVDEYTL